MGDRIGLAQGDGALLPTIGPLTLMSVYWWWAGCPSGKPVSYTSSGDSPRKPRIDSSEEGIDEGYRGESPFSYWRLRIGYLTAKAVFSHRTPSHCLFANQRVRALRHSNS